MSWLLAEIEWPAGSRWRLGDRRTRYPESAPANYGHLPGSHNPADGSEVDAVVLGPSLPAGRRVRGRLVGMIALADGDHKLILCRHGHPRPGEIARVLSWFPPERRPRFAPAHRAKAWLWGKLGREG